jgi:glucosylceramidase
VGFQWAGKGVIGHVQEAYPQLKLMQTETECGRGTNDWKAMEHTFSLVKHYFGNGAEAYMYWNMVLDHTGKSQWGWKQNSMITIGEEGGVSHNPEFYLMKHFSAFVRPGARYLRLDADENCLAFVNPGGELVIVYYNESEQAKQRQFRTGSSAFTVDLPPKSLSTIRVGV